MNRDSRLAGGVGPASNQSLQLNREVEHISINSDVIMS